MLNAETLRGQVLFTADDSESKEGQGGSVEFVPCVDEADLLAAFWDVARRYDAILRSLL